MNSDSAEFETPIETEELSPREKLKQDSIKYHLELGRKYGIPDDRLNDYANDAAQITLETADKVSKIDSKYNILNSEGLKQVLEIAVEASRRYNIPLSAAFIDLKGLGELNTTFGQAGGDKGIKTVVVALEQNARTTDIPAIIPTPEAIRENGGNYGAREGGDEFVVVFLDTPLDGAVTASQRIMEAISQESDKRMPEYRQRFNRPLDSRAGVAQFDPDVDKDSQEFLNRIGAAMYKTKIREGKMGVSAQIYEDSDYHTVIVKSFKTPPPTQRTSPQLKS